MSAVKHSPDSRGMLFGDFWISVFGTRIHDIGVCSETPESALESFLIDRRGCWTGTRHVTVMTPGPIKLVLLQRDCAVEYGESNYLPGGRI